MTMQTATDHLLTALSDERAQLRELAACVVERLRVHQEITGDLPAAVREVIGAALLQRVIAASDRVEALGLAIDYAQEAV